MKASERFYDTESWIGQDSGADWGMRADFIDPLPAGLAWYDVMDWPDWLVREPGEAPAAPFFTDER